MSHDDKASADESHETAAIKTALIAGADGFSEVVGKVGSDHWQRPALGSWTVRDLTGHASRALSTVKDYMGQEPEPTAKRLEGPVAYFLAVRSADPDAIATRGKESGAALGKDPARAIRALAAEVTSLVESADPETIVTPLGGTMSLFDYLPTRTFELAVHSLDLVRAVGIEAPASLAPAISASCVLAGRLAAQLPAAGDLLLRLAGRTGLPEHLSVV